MARIAIVEDEVDISRIIKEVLGELGHDVVSYVNPSTDIVEHLRDYQPDLIFVDARLNESVSGWDIIDGLRAQNGDRRIPIILASGASEEIAERRGQLDAEGIPVLPKPFDLDALEALVEQIVPSGTTQHSADKKTP